MFAKFIVASCVAGVTASASAQFLSPTWTTGVDDTAYFEWDQFLTATGLNFPDVGQFPTDAVATIQETGGASIITSSGNLYSFAAAQQIEVIFDTNSPAANRIITDVLFQTSTLGTEWDYENVTIGDQPASTTTELERIDLGGGPFGGFIVTTAFEFRVLGADQLTIDAPAFTSSLSLDIAIVDSFSRPTCDADVNLDFQVDLADLLAVLASFGGQNALADLDQNGAVELDDLLSVLSEFGSDCP